MKLRFQNVSKRKAGVFKFLLFEEGFRKAPFSCRISVDLTAELKSVYKFLQRSVDVALLSNILRRSKI